MNTLERPTAALVKNPNQVDYGIRIPDSRAHRLAIRDIGRNRHDLSGTAKDLEKQCGFRIADPNAHDAIVICQLLHEMPADKSRTALL